MHRAEAITTGRNEKGQNLHRFNSSYLSPPAIPYVSNAPQRHQLETKHPST